ncbi:uncharacterized protein LOC129218721 [Uloborus diversus]|uniref:uncharacterized protein LOC129218721 n=1 Tax=Uloborus diversus TaxID=327109 RepID=UPI002409CD6C|nr:uncharacterized protein LOC129218721 [Uloborus diversus]
MCQVRIPICRGLRCHIRRLFFLIFCWVPIGYLFLYVIHLHENGQYSESSNLGRGLLQQEPVDYVHETTVKTLNMELKIDKSVSMNEKDLLKMLSKDSNLPLSYFANWKSKKTNYKCLKYPSLYELDFNNVYWQRMTSPNATFYLYGAYYDNRKQAGKVPMIRIIGMVDKIKPPPTYCQFWFDGLSKETILETGMYQRVSYTYMWFSKWGNHKDGILQPFIMSCKIPAAINDSAVPVSVSLVSKLCEKPTNNLKVNHKVPQKREDFAVCVKGLDFLYEDISVRLVEWIELLNILGAQKIFFHEIEVHPNISKVLSYYAKRGLVEVTPITLPGPQPNLPGFRHLYLKSKVVHKRQNELIPYNDCFYKNMYSYRYIALLDTDEVIMPLIHENWKDLMEEVIPDSLTTKNETKASYNFRNVYFLDDLQDGKEMTHQIHEEGIPRYLHILQHVYRSENYTKPGSYVKCFHNADQVLSLHNHFPLNCLGRCYTHAVNTSLAHLQHYRKDCVGPLKKSCNEFRNHTVRDTSVWRFKDEVIRRTTEVLTNLEFFKF